MARLFAKVAPPSSHRICGSCRSCEDQARQEQGGWLRRRRNSQRRPRFRRVDWHKDVGIVRRKRCGRFGVSHSFDKFYFAGCITLEDETVATFGVVEHGCFLSAIPATSVHFSHCLSCQEFATNKRNATVDCSESFEQGVLVHEEDVESRHGLRGVRVGEASHPGPPRRRISRQVEGRDVIPRMHFNGATQVDEDSDVADVSHVSQCPRRCRRRVSSDSDVPLVRDSRFAVLTESDDQSDIEPLICPAGQTRDEDDVNTVPASSGAVAAHLGAISGDAGQFFSVPAVPESVFLSTSLI